jgi:polyisoprenoid-binding protein YceI
MAAAHNLIGLIRLFMKKFQLIAPLIIAMVLTCGLPAQTASSVPPTHEVELEFDPAQSSATIALSGNFHTVEGSFTLKHGVVKYDPATGKVGGEIVFDATSGKTGNDGRDRKMHKEVLESARFPEISFLPDHAEGAFTASGDSTLQVHGTFSIHDADHELTIPVTVHLGGSNWKARAAFQVPYAKWGMKNPSVIFLRVAGVVDVQLVAAGSVR